MRRFMFLHEHVEENGKTIKENNLEIKHKIPIGALVEIIPWDGYSRDKYEGMRLYVSAHGRDCDGTPLYTLGANNKDSIMDHGFSDDILKVIKK